MSANQRVALVTGGNRGLGLETVRQLARKGIRVILTSRDEAKGRAALEKLHRDGLNDVVYHPLDVTSSDSIERVERFVREKFGRLDILVNNAGVVLDSPEWDFSVATVFKAKIDTIRRTMETNVYGPIQLAQRFVPLMLEKGYGRVVNVSSGMGQLSEMNGGWPGYRISKSAINAVTRIFADEVANDPRGKNVLVNSVCPGWVRTDMGGPEAELSVEEGADTLVWLATLPEGGPSGGFFRERERIDW